MISKSTRILHTWLYLFLCSYIFEVGELSGLDIRVKIPPVRSNEHVSPTGSITDRQSETDLQNTKFSSFHDDKADKTLLLTQVIFRHGDRSPIHTYPNDPHKNAWPQGLGQLTKIGMNQAYKLGLYMQHRYQDFLQKGYKSNEVFIRSTDSDRTLMTAECVAAGLFPVRSNSFTSEWPLGTWQPVPVHTVAEQNDRLIDAKDACQYIKKIDKQLDANFSAGQKLMNDKDLISVLTQGTGMDINVTSLHFLADIIFCQKSHHLSMPSWMTSEILGKLMDYKSQRASISPENAKYLSGTLLYTVIQNMMRKAGNDSDSTKIYIYSTHDSTVGPLLSLLGHDDQIQVPYTAAAIIELHKVDGNYSVKIFYRNDTTVQPYTIIPFGCSNTYPCLLDVFHREFEHRILTDEGWERVCDDSSTSKKDIKDGHIPILLAVLVALVGLNVCLGIKAYGYWQRLKKASNHEYSLLRTAAEEEDGEVDMSTPPDTNSTQIEDSDHELLREQ